MTDQTTEDTAAYCTCSAMRAIVDHHLKPMSAENAELKHRNADLFRRLGEHMDDLGDARTENTKLAAALTEAEAERESDPVVLDLRARLDQARTENRVLKLEPSNARWDELVTEKDQLIEETERLRALAANNQAGAVSMREERDQARAERDALAAALAEARELARRWQRYAHKHREIADSRPGLTQIERAEIRQAATEIEQCSRQLVAEIGPDPAERVETTTHADPEPHGLAAIRDRVKSDPILTEAEIDGASSGWIELMQARRDRAELLAALDTELDEQTRPDPAVSLRVRLVSPDTAAPGPAPLTLAQAATSLHDWAGDLADGARTGWPAGHPDIIRAIRAAADWLDARDKYETEAREQHLTALREAGRRLGESFQQLGEAIRDGAAKARAEHEEREQLRALVDRHGMADRTCLIGDDTTE